jgi:hypothetical protein
VRTAGAETGRALAARASASFRRLVVGARRPAGLERHGLQNVDGGFELEAGRGSDAQSTAWSIQAFLAAGRRAGAPAFAYLARLRRADGSYRYSARYTATPVWVTAQVLPALARKAFPLPRR